MFDMVYRHCEGLAVFLLLIALTLGPVPAQTLAQIEPAPDAGPSTEPTMLKGAAELEPSAQALLRQRFEGWTLEWVANVRTKQTLYSIVYGIKDPLSAMILTSTDLESGTSRLVKADNSLFPFDEQRRGTPPMDVRIALAEALVRKNSARYGSVSRYVTALRNNDMVRYLAPEQRQAIINLGGRIPK
jgi:hypothetical protein